MVSKNLRILSVFFSCILSAAAFCPAVYADIQDPFDPFDIGSRITTSEDDDRDKPVEELLLEAEILLNDERLLDARTKLLRALKKDPKDYRTHMMLSGYYMQHVGHFLLALKYTKQAGNLFFEKNGKPQYTDPRTQAQHSHLLYLLSQARLNLDDYQGALDVLDEYTSYGYYSSWYPGTRAWILMKLGRLEEAIKVARTGIFSGAEPGRTLNMLGILLSMHGDREESLQIFREAITYELALGESGQPATPLNNSGEVYKETFQEDKAEASWLKATRLPDGCEHVLPSLNLSLLYIEQLNFAGAKKTMNNFESCVAQFALRNGEEHRALVHLARGRVDLHSGNVDSAIKHLESALEERQWFGKIGTTQADLQAGATVSLAQALRAKNEHLRLKPSRSVAGWFAESKQIAENSVRSWWLMRRARQILTEDLSDIEDLYIRNTDSMLEYPTFGELLSGMPTRALEARLSFETKDDRRPEASVYYKAYLAENYYNNFRKSKALELIDQVLSSARPKYDDLLRTHVLLLKSRYFDTDSEEYQQITFQIFSLNRAKLRNYGVRLPVNFRDLTPEIQSLFKNGPLILGNSKRRHFAVRYEYAGNEHILYFISTSNAVGNIKVKGTDIERVVDKFIDAIFVEEAGREK